MFFCVLLISTTNISDYNVNYTNYRFHSNLYNAVRTSEDTQQIQHLKTYYAMTKYKQKMGQVLDVIKVLIKLI